VDGERLLGQVPEREDGGQRNGEERSRHEVGDAQPDMQDVCCHSAEDSDHGHSEPVDPWHIAARRELQRERTHQSDAPQGNRNHWRQPVHEVVRARLTHPGGQPLGDPEGDGHRWDSDRSLSKAGMGAVLLYFLGRHQTSVTGHLYLFSPTS
jgi:hypothetical protein